MIIVRGEVKISQKDLDQAIELSLAHVQRSRSEPGCKYHSVGRNLEATTELTFYEEWADIGALKQHFAQPSSQQFFATLTSLALAKPVLKMYSATAVTL